MNARVGKMGIGARDAELFEMLAKGLTEHWPKDLLDKSPLFGYSVSYKLTATNGNDPD